MAGVAKKINQSNPCLTEPLKEKKKKLVQTLPEGVREKESERMGHGQRRKRQKMIHLFHLVADKMSGPFIEKQASQRRNW